jgi:hypothetical protein
MKREIPIMITLIFGMFMITQFFIPHPLLNRIAGTLQEWAIIVIAFSYVLGSANILRINGEIVYRRGPDWPYKLALVISFLLMSVTGLIVRSPTTGCSLVSTLRCQQRCTRHWRFLSHPRHSAPFVFEHGKPLCLRLQRSL